MGIFGRTVNMELLEVDYNGYYNFNYGLYDTFVVSFSRYSEFKRLMAKRNIDERSHVIGSMCVSHTDVYYADEYGHVTKYQILED